MPHLTTSAVVAVACLGAIPATLSAAPPPAGTETARIVAPTVARTAPAPRARVALALSPYTPYTGTAHVLMVTGRTTGADGRKWVRVALPKRPNGVQGWVLADHVQLSTVRTRIRVSLRARTVQIWRNGRKVYTTRAAIGKGATPTPVGAFAVNDPVPTLGHERSTYGPYIITLTAYSTVLKSFMGGNGLVAIHGTSNRSQLGQAVSHGCVRVSNDALRTIQRAAKPGVPVDIVR